MNLDPTLSEMQAFLLSNPYAAEADSLDVAQAIYWFANDWHSGQWSNLYAALCGVGYTPGACENGCDCFDVAAELYAALEAEYAP